MSKIGRLSLIGYTLIATQLLGLSACSMIKPADHARPPAPVAVAATSQPLVIDGKDGDGALKEHRVIVPSEEIAKEGLQLSYSLKTVANGSDNLLQLSLVFRNTTNKSMAVVPKVELTDAKGSVLPFYTKKAFDKAAAEMLDKSRQQRGKHAKSEANLLREQLDWDKAFWLPAHFKIPEGGIQIGGLVFHHEQPVTYPLSLHVESEGRRFQFAVKDPATAIVKKSDDKKSR